ncbi:hypothetical protein [uncultured Algibacter sp.]|uniref:hypothetical protein n=1 Tax=uncultured Algibacter sp. TaxID=298659 RepID=UPI00262CCDEF|nr:hypothetical protein [uncultured Algibacter sp.]
MKKLRTKAQIERGIGTLKSLTLVINVLYALMIFQTFLILPRPDDPALKFSTLTQIYEEHVSSLIVIVIGLIMIIIYWIQFNRQLGNLVRSTPMHATLTILQMFCLMIYLYFVRIDMEMDGLKLALQMQSVFLALAGFLGAYNWLYATKKELTSNQIDENEEKAFLLSSLPEPTAALISLPFASISPTVWTISFLVIIPLTYFFKYLGKRKTYGISNLN